MVMSLEQKFLNISFGGFAFYKLAYYVVQRMPPFPFLLFFPRIILQTVRISAQSIKVNDPEVGVYSGEKSHIHT